MNFYKLSAGVRVILGIAVLTMLASEGVELLRGTGADQLFDDYFVLSCVVYAAIVAITGRFVFFDVESGMAEDKTE